MLRKLSRVSPGKYVKLADTVRSFKEIVEGKYDDLPEQAFYMVGPIEEAIEKAEKLGHKTLMATGTDTSKKILLEVVHTRSLASESRGGLCLRPW